MESVLTFEQWKTDIAEVTTTLVGLLPEDLNDVPYWDMWKKNVSSVSLGLYVSCLHRSTSDTSYNIKQLTNFLKDIPEDDLIEELNSIHGVIQDISNNRKPV